MRVLIYSPQGGNSIYRGDPEISIHWPIHPERSVLSDRSERADAGTKGWRRRSPI